MVKDEKHKPSVQDDDFYDDDLPVEEAGAQTAAPLSEAEERLQKAEEKAKENWDLALRTRAEMDNLRRRMEREMDNARKYAVERFASELLLVADSLDQGLVAAMNAEDKGAESILSGIELTRKVLMNTLEKFGITPIDPVGQAFDSNLHEAISLQPHEEAASGTVTSVMQKGYRIHDRVLRPARVIVAQ